MPQHYWRLPLLLITALALLMTPSAPATAQDAQSPRRPGLFGLNMYITGRERDENEARALIGKARRIGAAWSREEISWAAWGNDRGNRFYDRRIKLLTDAGIGVIGMLLTTPERYSSPECLSYAHITQQPAYWCAPTDPAAYAAWAAGVVERYDGDGIDDAPGSPRIDAWEIWNEPDQDGTWLPHADPVAYAHLLRAAHDAIKAADPTALVLNGGVMTFDGVGVNNFMSQVVAVAGWDSFDVLSLHPWLIDYAPDEPSLINPRERYDVTIPGRLAMAQRWVDEHGGGKPIWITEVGWSVCGGVCAPQFAKSEDQQADYMVRTFILAAAAGIEHVSYFQLEDKFSGAQIPWSQAALLRDDLSPRSAYRAYATLVGLLHAATFRGVGALHQPGVLADYQFALPDGGIVDVVWSLNGARTIDIPRIAGLSATLIERDGALTPLGDGRTARINVGERPVYVRQSNAALRGFAETGRLLGGIFRDYWERNGGAPVFGLPISPAHIARGEDGRDYLVQWFERNRFEYHPENAPPHNVLLGRLGVEALKRQGIDWRELPAVDSAPENCRYFPETRHSLCHPFLQAWERDGGLAVFGFPISEPFAEMNAEDGQNYIVQYFERARFEHHPENLPPYDVQLSRLGALFSGYQ